MLQARQVPKVRQVLLVRRELKDLPVLPDPLVPRVPQVSQVLLDHKVQLVLPEFRVQPARLVLRELQASPVLPVLKALLE